MCSKVGPLEAGHIIPAFVYRWLKKTSATGHLRGGENPNVRIQDGWKRRWFCRSCEDQIGRFERAFSEELFPLVVEQRPGPYRHGPWLSRFLASLAWRTLMLHSEEGEAFDFFTPEQKAMVQLAMEQWRAFVHGEASTPGVHELHFIPMGILGDCTLDGPLPPNINRYTMRSIEIHVASNTAQAFAFVKMGPAVAFGFIQPPPPDTWVGTRVALGEGTVGGRMAMPVQVLEYFIDRAEKARRLDARRSARQLGKIGNALAANMERATASETFRAVEADVLRFGIERVFSSEDEPEAGKSNAKMPPQRRGPVPGSDLKMAKRSNRESK